MSASAPTRPRIAPLTEYESAQLRAFADIDAAISSHCCDALGEDLERMAEKVRSRSEIFLDRLEAKYDMDLSTTYLAYVTVAMWRLDPRTDPDPA